MRFSYEFMLFNCINYLIRFHAFWLLRDFLMRCHGLWAWRDFMFLLHIFLMRFPYESSCFLLHNGLMRFHAFEPLRDFLMRFHAYLPLRFKEVQSGGSGWWSDVIGGSSTFFSCALTVNVIGLLFLLQCFIRLPSSTETSVSGTSRKLPLCMQVS